MPATRGSVFRKFVDELTAEWARKWPRIRRIEESFGTALPKASTFYAGSHNALSRHVFLKFQRNPKSWNVGSFTVNIIISEKRGLPSRWALPHRNELDRGAVGSYRLGSILYGMDKWWSLLPTDWKFGMPWTPSSYEDADRVRRETILDVTADVERFLRRIDCAELR